ncbi:hypothetical protein ANTPLA_LOCUS7546 [Anthophora plagiata]
MGQFKRAVKMRARTHQDNIRSRVQKGYLTVALFQKRYTRKKYIHTYSNPKIIPWASRVCIYRGTNLRDDVNRTG